MGSPEAAGPSTASPPAGRGQAQGLDALPRRTSSAAPAPQSPLEHLSDGPLENILGRLVTGSTPFESVRNLSAVLQTSRTLRQSVVSNPALWSTYQRHGADCQAVIESVGQAVTEFTDRISNLAVHQRVTRGRRLLQFVPTGQRDSLVDAVLALPDGRAKAVAIDELGPWLAPLETTQRDALVAATLQLSDADDKALAIGGLGAGLAHLEPCQRNALAATAISLPPDANMAYKKFYALSGLAAGLATLQPTQSDELVDAVLGVPDELNRAKAIGNLGRGGLQHLSESRRDTVVNAAISLPGDELKATAMAGLGAGLEGLNPQQLGVLVETAIGLANDRYKSSAIAGLGAGLKALSPTQRDALVKAVPGLSHERYIARAICGLGAGLAYLEPGQHTALVAAVTAMQGRHHKAWAILGLARGLASLDPALRGTLVDMARGESSYKMEVWHPAIGALGPELAHLSADQREALVNATVRNASARQFEAIAGLGKAMMCLTPTQAQALLSAARNIEDAHQAAVALAGLAEGAAKLRPRPAPVV